MTHSGDTTVYAECLKKLENRSFSAQKFAGWVDPRSSKWSTAGSGRPISVAITIFSSLRDLNKQFLSEEIFGI
jgi:hypothetical protein